MAKTISGIVTWLKNWFYDKTEITGFLNAKANVNQGTANYNVVTDASGNITVEPKINVASNGGLSLNASTNTLSHSNNQVEAHGGAFPTIIAWDTRGHITNYQYLYSSSLSVSPSDATKVDVKISNIETAISNLQSFKALEIVTTKPTASVNTMGKLYIVSENSKVNVYYTKATTSNDTTTYAWQKMDTDILDDLTVNWSDIQNKPSSFTPSSHTHGKLQNDGVVKSITGVVQSSMNLVTDADGNLTTESKNHRSSLTTYGVGDATHYGHNKVIDALNKSSYTDGESLSAHQGYVLNQAIDNRVTSIDLVPYADDATGAIKLYYGDEPSSS